MPNYLLTAELANSGKLPSGLLFALVPLLVLVVALDVYCLIDLARAKSVRIAPKIVWAIVILFVSAPIGALIYLFAGRDRDSDTARREAGTGRQDADTGQHEAGAGQQEASAGRHEEVAAPNATELPGRSGSPGWDRLPPRHGGAPAAPHPDSPPPGSLLLRDPRPPQELPPARERPPIVTTSGLTKDYGGTGLFDVDLRVPRGSVYGLVGPNGAGKTTLLSLLSTIRRPDRGTISMDIGRNQIAVCPDVPEFDRWLTAAEVVDLARSLVAPGADGGAVAAALDTAGLADSAGRRVGGFSRGMVQRLGLACALVGAPELLILDEPTSALDPAGRAEMLGLVAAMRGHRTVIFSSHILADVQRIADQVGILRDGRLLYQGPTGDLIDTYLEPSWLVRSAGDPAPVAAAMTGQPWATKVEPAGAETIRVDATSVEAGERGIPAVLAACGARQVSCEPRAADLESAFLALTGANF
jgi:ABC-2 type transport system ATP-binding protein